MRTFLLTWNPQRWEWTDLPEVAKSAHPNSPFRDRWSCGKRKDVKPGERVFLLRQSVEPRGILGSGTVLSPSYQDDHWDEIKAAMGERANFIDVAFDTVLDPSTTSPVSASAFPELGHRINWKTQMSGTEIQPEDAEVLERIWALHNKSDKPVVQFPAAEIDDEEISFPEGREVFRLHRQRERSSRLVKMVKDKAAKCGKLHCQVCGFDFSQVYGALGQGFIEAHHALPVSMLSTETPTRVSDIALVCSNCHKMLHRRRPWLSIEALTAILKVDA